jgi:hypothetical protein
MTNKNVSEGDRKVQQEGNPNNDSNGNVNGDLNDSFQQGDLIKNNPIVLGRAKWWGWENEIHSFISGVGSIVRSNRLLSLLLIAIPFGLASPNIGKYTHSLGHHYNNATYDNKQKETRCTT